MKLKLTIISLQQIILLFSLVSFLQVQSQTGYKISGQVIDFDTRQPLKSISVTIRSTKKGTITNDSGYFSLTIPVQEVTLHFSSVGYVNQNVSMSANGENIIIPLKKRADEQLDEVLINSNTNSTKVRATEMNVVRINPESIKRTPLLLGEADIIKSLLLQPGINTTGEGAGGFNVRGGNADQNLVLLDGAPVFNTSHLLGFYTSISPDAIQDATLYKGGMPASFGGRLSSLLNIRAKTGNNQKEQYNGGIGPVSARFNASGPVIKEKMSFNGGFRVAYPNFVLNQLPEQYGESRAFFYDGLLKSEYNINTNNKIALTGYRSYDRFQFDENTEYEWLSNLAALNYSANLNSRLVFRLHGNYSQFHSSINNLETNYQYKVTSSIAQKQIKASFLYQLGEKNKIEIGADNLYYDILPGKRQPNTTSSNIISTTLEKEKGKELAAFLLDEITITDKISVQAGVRYVLYDYLGPKKTYEYETGIPMAKETITDSVSFSKNKSIQQYSGIEPRFAFKIELREDLSFKLSYNRGQQFLHMISNTTAISPVDFWKLSDRNIKQAMGDQFAAGIFKTYKNNQYLVSLETYYKRLKNVVQYKDGAQLVLNPYIESSLLNSRGRAYGAELSFSKNSGKFTGQINYTYSRAEVQVQTVFPQEMVNNGDWYPSDYDRPHNLAIITRLALGKGWSFNNNFVLVSGRAVTFPDGNYSFNGTLVNNFSKRNMDRLPLYHRLDAGFSYISKRYPQQKRYSMWNISFYNLYMHKNAYSIFFKKNGDDLFFARDHDSLISYRLSVIGTIIPSVTWNFYF